MAIYAYSAMRRSAPAWHTRIPWRSLDDGSTVFTLFGAGLLGLAYRVFPDVYKLTHGTLITADAWARGVLRRLCNDRAGDDHLRLADPDTRTLGTWQQHRLLGVLDATGRHVRNDSLLTAGIAQVYLERILGMGYLDVQLKIQVHFLMLLATASLFSVGVGCSSIFDFFRYAPRFEVSDEKQPERRGRMPGAQHPSRDAVRDALAICAPSTSTARHRRRSARSPTTCRRAMKWHCSSNVMRTVWRSCSKGRPVAARPVSSNTWHGACNARWSPFRATTT